MLPGRRTETRSPVLRDLLCGPRVLGEHEVRTSSPHGQTTCPPVGWGKTRWVHEPIYKCESNDGPVQCAKRENLTASCLTRNVGTRSPVRRLVSAVICASEEIVTSFRAPIYRRYFPASRSDPLFSIYSHIPLPYLLPVYPLSLL